MKVLKKKQLLAIIDGGLGQSAHLHKKTVERRGGFMGSCDVDGHAHQA